MSIMDFFRPQAAQTPVAQQAPAGSTENGQQQQVANPTADPTKVAGAEPEKVSGLDAFKDVWQTKPKEEGAPEEFNPSKIFDLNQESMNKALASVDFTKGITEDHINAIQAGGPEAMKALSEMLNNTARQTMGAATQASAKMIESALTGAQGSLDRKINTQVRSNQVASHLQESNPALNHPAAAPLVKALQTQFESQHPKANPQEISEMVTKYMVGFADLAAGKKQETSEEAAPGAGNTDWESYFTK